MKRLKWSTLLLCAATVPLSGELLAQTSSPYGPAPTWAYRAAIYVWLPDVSGTTRIPTGPGGGPNVDLDLADEFGKLKSAFMGNFEASNGRWGWFTDYVYANIGSTVSNTRNFSIGNIGIPASTTANVSLSIKGSAWTVAGTYRLINASAGAMDFLVGTRYLGIKEPYSFELNGDLGGLPPTTRQLSGEPKTNLWDGIVGVKGNFNFGTGNAWTIPYYLDVGAGQSQHTFQALIGIGYKFSAIDVTASYRYLDYKMKSGNVIDSLTLAGPMIGVGFRWW